MPDRQKRICPAATRDLICRTSRSARHEDEDEDEDEATRRLYPCASSSSPKGLDPAGKHRVLHGENGDSDGLGALRCNRTCAEIWGVF